MRRLVSIVSAFASVCVLSPLPSSASFVDDYVGGENGLYADLLSDTLEHFDLSNTAASTDVTYVFGSYNGWYCTCIWIGMESYRSQIDTTAGVPETDFYHSSTYACAFNSSYVGHGYVAEFYFDDVSDYYILHSLYTTSPGNYNSVSSKRDTHFLNEIAGTTIGDNVRYISSQLVSPDATEPSTDSGFQLPDSWIDGGETLPAATELTFPSGFDPEAAYDQFENISYDIDDGVKSGIGFFWEVLIRVIGSLDIWSYVFFAMLFTLIIWFIKGQ